MDYEVLLPASGTNSFWNLSDARATENYSVPGITHITKIISRCRSQLGKMKYRLQIVH